MDELPKQLDGTPWPTAKWPTAALAPDVDGASVDRVLGRLLSPEAHPVSGDTRALLVVHRGLLVAERYGPEYSADHPFCSWSMAKSITHALVGMRVRDGKLDVDAPAPVPAWQEQGDRRRAIRLDDLLRMVDGLDFTEDYVDEGVSHVIEMLFGSGKPNVTAYAESRPYAHEPGSVWNYSSGTSNIVSGILSRSLGGGEPELRAFMQRELFEPLGMQSADPRFDEAGNFIASSFVFATARDFARFGLLYLRDGCWEQRRLLPEGWVDHARSVTSASLGEYGAHWWLAMDGSGIFNASGYRGQYIVVDPRRDLVIVRLGDSETEQRGALLRSLAELDRAFPEA